MTKQIFPLVRPDIPAMAQWQDTLNSIYESNQFSNGGATWTTLNYQLEKYFPDRSVVAVGNNTVGQISVLDALHVRGKKVLISNFTFAATLQAVVHAGGIPVIADVDLVTGEIGIDNVEQAISEYGVIDFVLFTRIFGQRRNIKELEEFLDSRNISLIIDAAAGFPTTQVEPSNAIEIFSFHATKAFSVGEGGAIVGPKDKMKNVWESCNFGIREANSFYDGINSKMDEFTAARSLAMLHNFPEIADQRNKFVNNAYKKLQESEKLETLFNDGSWAWSLYPIKFENTSDMKEFSGKCTSAGLSGKRYYWPSMSQGYKGSAHLLKVSSLENSETWSSQTYCLPVYARYTSIEIEQITEIISSALLTNG